MNKEHIINEIRRTAKSNGGVALGRQRFEAETGIRFHDRYGRFWTSWSAAVCEAGLEPNRMSEAYDVEVLVEKLVRLTRRLKRVPTDGELRLATRDDPTFPSHSTFRRLGLKPRRVSRVIAFCEGRPEYDEVAALWRDVTVAQHPQDAEEDGSATSAVGYVYLLKHGSRREYKIGRTYDPLRREGELGIQLPEKLRPIHYIKTDDPGGIETYWHTRFASKRKEGEWFALTPNDVRAFRAPKERETSTTENTDQHGRNPENLGNGIPVASVTFGVFRGSPFRIHGEGHRGGSELALVVLGPLKRWKRIY